LDDFAPALDDMGRPIALTEMPVNIEFWTTLDDWTAFRPYWQGV
jgi:hypothetical protein